MYLTKSHDKYLPALFRQGFLVALPMLVVANLIIWFGYSMSVEGIRERWRALSELSADSTLLSLDQRWNDIRADLNLLAANPNLGTAVSRKDKVLLTEIAAHWELFASEKQLYDQIRLIDVKGMEQVRVNLTPYGASRVSQSKLQNKSHRYYYREAISLYPGQIYASPIDLNYENGKIEIPYKPMLRLATPVVDSRGKKVALLVLNVLASYIFDNLARHAQFVEGRLILLDSSSYYLRGFSADQEWAFMFSEDQKQDPRFENTFPEVWAKMKGNESGMIDHQKGIFSYRMVRYGVMGKEQQYKLVVAMSDQQQQILLASQQALWSGVSLSFSLLMLIISLFMARNRLEEHKSFISRARAIYLDRSMSR
jgi:hypothetical protein